VLQVIARVGDTDSPVLISGPAGVGKRLVARVIHARSRRRLGPFLWLDCRGLPEHLLEAELFGHGRGSRNDNANERKGLFQEANCGTVLLCGVESIPVSLQDRVLQLLQDRESRPFGDSTLLRVDVRLLGATSESLESKLALGTFRQGLYDALNVVSVSLPALSERREDIPLLISSFISGKRHRQDGKPFVFTPEALDACCGYAWPGNIFELQQAVDCACALSEDSSIRLSALPLTVQRRVSGQDSSNHAHTDLDNQLVDLEPSSVVASQPVLDKAAGSLPMSDQMIPLRKFLRDQELMYLNRILEQVGGSKERAAELLGISLATIYRKLADPTRV